MQRISSAMRFTPNVRRWLAGAALGVCCACGLELRMRAQQPAPAANALAVDRAASGDAPADPGPLATDLSPALKRSAVRAAMKKVADWQLRTGEARFNAQWTFAALYDGLLAASKTLGDAKYRDAVERFAEGRQWKLVDTRFPNADDMALGQAYLELYLSDAVAARKPEQMANTQANLDRLLARPDDAAKDLWWWSDALFMAPPVLARMSLITGDRKYDAFLDKEWDITTQHLYDPAEQLYFRDSRFFTQKEANGKKIFWARGNGWVVAALVKVLEVLPANDPSRPKYVHQLREMCGAAAALQGADGLWRSGLLNPGGYELPEISGSSFFLYAMAFGVNEHLLERRIFEPAIERGWKGLMSHIYADGRLGSIQPIDAQPGKFTPGASSVYGVGAFLLAGYEVDRLAGSSGRPVKVSSKGVR